METALVEMCVGAPMAAAFDLAAVSS